MSSSPTAGAAAISRIPQPTRSPNPSSPLANPTNSSTMNMPTPTPTPSGGPRPLNPNIPSSNAGSNTAAANFKTNNPFVSRLTPLQNPNSLLPKTPSTPPLHIQPRGKENNLGLTRFSPRQTPPHLLQQQQHRGPSSPSPAGGQSRVPSPSGRGPGSKLSPGPSASPGRTLALSPSSPNSNGGNVNGSGNNGNGGQQKVRKIPSGLTRRPVPLLSPDLRQSQSPPGGKGGNSTGGGGALMRKISMGKGGPNKSCLRPQPSVPLLRSEQAEARAREELAANRKRANSANYGANLVSIGTGGLAPAAQITGTRIIPIPNPAHTTRFATEIDSIPPPANLDLGVPQHIRLRLRLLSHLARTLEVDQSDISRRIDVPGLLARVDKAYERRAGMSDDRREVGTTGVPMPAAPAMGEDERWWMFPEEEPAPAPIGLGLKSSASLTSLGLGGGLSSSFSLSSLGLGLGLGRDKDKDKDKDKERIKEGVEKVQDEKDREKRNGMLGRLKRMGRKSLDERERPTISVLVDEEAYDKVWNVPIFGISLVDLPSDGWCTTKVGGQDHELPIPVYLLIEEIYRRGMDVPGIFRLAGKEAEVTKHYDTCNTPPFYGDGTDLSSPNVHSLCNVLKRFMRDLPEPILDDSLFTALWELCCAPDFPTGSVNCQRMDTPSPSRLAAAILILKMLPPQHFSLLVYALAFVTQLQFHPGNRLTLDAISIIFGPALLASRAKGVPGLGSGSRGKKHDPEVVSAVVDQSQKALGWLVRNWPEISKEILESPFPNLSSSTPAADPAPIDPRLLSPIIDMRNLGGRTDSPFAAAAAASATRSLDLDRTSIYVPAAWDVKAGEKPKEKEKPKMPGMLRSALSSRNLSGSFKEEKEKAPKRSASFNSLSSVFKKGMGIQSKIIQPSPTFSDVSDIIQTPSLGAPSSPTPSITAASLGLGKAQINPQITNVLGSLQDLLLGKDRQIERDARELALLRHTLLEMDEKLQKSLSLSQAKSSSSTGPDLSTLSAQTQTPLSPQIKITASPSVVSMNDTLLADLQSQLATALSALTQSRETTKQKDRQLVDLHTALARAESTRKIEMGKLEVALAMETARCRGLREERDLARERLEKVKKELFAVN